MSVDTMNVSAIANDKPVAKEAAPKRRFSALGAWQTVGPIAVCLLMFTIVVISNPSFLTGGGPGILALQATFILLVALGQSTVLNIGSIDL